MFLTLWDQDWKELLVRMEDLENIELDDLKESDSWVYVCEKSLMVALLTSRTEVQRRIGIISDRALVQLQQAIVNEDLIAEQVCLDEFKNQATQDVYTRDSYLNMTKLNEKRILRNIEECGYDCIRQILRYRFNFKFINFVTIKIVALSITPREYTDICESQL